MRDTSTKFNHIYVNIKIQVQVQHNPVSDNLWIMLRVSPEQDWLVFECIRKENA